MALGTTPIRAEEIAPFRVTGVDGYANLRYLRDDFSSDSGGSIASSNRQQQSDMRTEVFVNARGYIYHPNLLALEVGGGPILQRQRYTGDGGDISYSGTQYNLSLRAILFKEKAYRGSFFFEHLNPTQSVAPGQIITQENQRYGGEISVLAPATPVPVNVAVTHSESKGKGADRVLNDNTDQLTVRASHSFGTVGNTQVQYQTQHQTSQSGSSSLPIQASRNDSESLTVDTRPQLGSANNLDLTQLFAMNRRSYESGAGNVPTQSDMRLMLDLRHRPTDKLQEFVTADVSRNQQGDQNSTQQSLSAGMNYWPRPGLEIAAGAREQDSNSESFSSRSHSANGSVNYQRELGPGTLQAGYSAAVDVRAQQATSATTSVLGEAVTLGGTGFVNLSHNHVTAGSVIVSNVTRTQIFVEGSDYLLTPVGANVRIQRLLGGAILDGEQVLVDYSYDVGGTYTYRQVDQNVSLGWNLGRYLSFSLHHLDSRPVLLSGESAFPFNTVSSTVWGVRGELPIPGLGWSVGGGYERESRKETLAPFERISADAYVQNDEPLASFGNLRLGTRRSRVDYGNPGQNVDLAGYELRYGAHPFFGLDLSATANYERDDGGLLPRRRVDAALNAQWRERKLSMTFSLMRTWEMQGDVQRARNLFQWLLRRDF